MVNIIYLEAETQDPGTHFLPAKSESELPLKPETEFLHLKCGPFGPDAYSHF